VKDVDLITVTQENFNESNSDLVETLQFVMEDYRAEYLKKEFPNELQLFHTSLPPKIFIGP